MDDRWTGAGAAKGFAVPLSAGLALWGAAAVLPVLQTMSYVDLYLPYGLVALFSVVLGLLRITGLVLVVLGAYRLLRALEIRLGAGRPAATDPVDVDRSADR